MGSRRMSSLKMTLPILALCLLLSITTQVLGKPSPKHLLIETEEQAKKTSGSNEDYQSDWWPNYQTWGTNTNQNQFSNTNTNTRTDISRDHITNSGQFSGNKNSPINIGRDNINQHRNSNCKPTMYWHSWCN